MFNKFIDLNRSFIPVSRDCSVGEEEYDYSTRFGLIGSKTWSDLLQLQRVVILAEANAGKTEELKFAARKLRSESKSAFFIRLEYLASDPDLDLAFDKNYGSKGEFEAWLNSGEEAWFFLDSVDEARLSGPDKFELAVQRFSRQMERGADRVHLYITSRVSEWYAQHDLRLIETHFPLGRANTASNDVGNENANGKNAALPQIFALAPLNTGQIRIFAERRGAENVERFLSEIDHSETDVFCRHPGDLIEVLDYWDKHKRIETRLELLRFQVESKLKEPDQKRDRVSPLSLERARIGAEFLAAAVIFQRTSRIFIPERTIDRKLKPLAIDPRDVLSGWDAKEIAALLQRSLFDPAVYGAVRFHHRSVREFLTAQWLKRLLDLGKSRQKIESLFFAERYGEQVSILSARPVLAWLVLMDEPLRSKTADIAPEVFLQGGDPSSLPVSERKSLLERYCVYMAENTWQWHSFDWSDVKRFAHRDLAETISRLLEKYAGHEEVGRLLLRMIFQKRISECADIALEIVLDELMPRRTKSYAIMAVGAAGSLEQKRQITAWILSDSNITDDNLIGDVVAACCSDALTVPEAVRLLSRITNRPEFSHKSIDRELETLVAERLPVDQLLPFLTGIFGLLKKRPLVDKRYTPYSKRYEWLLPFAALAVERLIVEKHPAAFDKNVMSAVMLASVSRQYSYVLREGRLAEVIPAWKKFNHALFWHQVHERRRQRQRKQDRVIDFWQMRIFSEYWQFDISDFDLVLNDIQTRRSKDDQRMAVSLAFEIYRTNGLPQKERERLKKTVAGKPELEQALHQLMRPPAISDEVKKMRRNEAARTRRSKTHKAFQEKEKERQRIWLIQNTKVLRDTSPAETGRVYNGMMWVRDLVRKKTQENSRWSAANWNSLVPELGHEVAEAYRDGCVGYWRKYNPKVCSEGTQTSGTSRALIIGLSGLDIESAENPEWPRNLSEDEAQLAARYAVNEVNGFPDWLPRLHGHFPEAVKGRLLAEIEWEFSRPKDGEPPHYVLDDIRWHWLKFVPLIVEELFYLLEKSDPNFSVVRTAIELICTTDQIDKKRIAALAKARFEAVSDEVQESFWMALWLRTDAAAALIRLEEILNSSAAEGSEKFAMHLVSALVGQRDERLRHSNMYSDYARIDFLSTLLALVYEHFPLANDNVHEDGVYTPDSRDRASEARSHLFSQLCTTSGKAAYLALIHLSQNHPETDFQAICRRRAKLRAEEDAETFPWSMESVSDFAREAEHAPRTHRELFDLVVSRLEDMKSFFENGDESDAEVWRSVKEEAKHCIRIAGWLREHSHGRYSVPREEELADGKRTDIRIHRPEVDAPVPIELKIADNNWSAADLAERLKNQLCGQYLRDPRSSCGVFLVVYRGKRNWQHPKSKAHMDFSELMRFLEKEATKILRSNSTIEAIEVVGIDLTKRNKPVQI